jgi:HK97 family phage major capsid protein
MKWWIKFLQGYNDGTTEFAKGAVIELDQATAESLVKMKLAEKTSAPETDLAKKLEEFATKTAEQIEKSIKDAIERVTKKVADIQIIPMGDNLDKMGGFKSTGEFVVSVIKGSRPTNADVDERLIKLNQSYQSLNKAPTGQNTLDDTEGGFLIPEQIAAGIWDNIRQNDELMGRTDMRQTSGNSLKIKRQAEVSRKDGYRHAGIAAYWLPEAEEYTSSKMKWGEMRLSLDKITALAYATDEEISDAAVALGPLFDKRAGEAIMFRVHESIINGTGAGQPLGILRSAALIEIPLEVNQGEQTILHRNINKMYHRMHPRLRSQAVWFVHPNLEENLEYISFNDDSTNQRPIYMPPGGLTSTPYGTLKGRPVIPLEYCYDFGQRGDIIFANLGEYVMLRKSGSDGGIKSASSIHVRFLFDETAFKFSFRIGGQPMWSAPIEDYRGTTKRSPFITLANRSGGSSSSGL